MPEVLVNGQWLSSLNDGTSVYPANPIIRTQWPRGDWEMTWDVNLPPGQRPPALLRQMRVEARQGPSPIFAGSLAEVDWVEGKMVAVGACREGEETLALTAGGVTTTTLNVAVDQAIARGALTWRRPYGLSATPFGDSDSTDNLNYLTALLDAWAAENGTVWHVASDRIVRLSPDPTVPSWHILPGAEPLASATEQLAGAIHARYLDRKRRYASVSAGTGHPEIGISLTARGAMSATRAQGIIDTLLVKLGAQGSWSSSPTVTVEQIVTPGGTRDPLAISRVRAGQMVRFLDQRTEAGLPFNTDVVLAETAWSVAEGRITLTPQGKVARDLRAVVAEVGGELL